VDKTKTLVSINKHIYQSANSMALNMPDSSIGPTNTVQSSFIKLIRIIISHPLMPIILPPSLFALINDQHFVDACTEAVSGIKDETLSYIVSTVIQRATDSATEDSAHWTSDALMPTYTADMVAALYAFAQSNDGRALYDSLISFPAAGERVRRIADVLASRDVMELLCNAKLYATMIHPRTQAFVNTPTFLRLYQTAIDPRPNMLRRILTSIQTVNERRRNATKTEGPNQLIMQLITVIASLHHAANGEINTNTGTRIQSMI